jgi:hypothetical protein
MQVKAKAAPIINSIAEKITEPENQAEFQQLALFEWKVADPFLDSHNLSK